MNKKLNKSLRILTILILWGILILASYKAYGLYQYNKLHPQKEYSWQSFELPPEEFVIKNDMMKSTKNVVLLGMLVAIIWEVLLYFDDPEKHFITGVWEKVKPIMKKVGDNIEDDEDEK